MKGEVSHDVAALRRGEFGRVIVELDSGSHLYGTATENSDRDIRGVFIPTPAAILAGDFPKAVCTKSTGEKNKPGDEDVTFQSLHHFIALCLKGETNALDWLHAPPSMLTSLEPEWLDLLAMRRSFYCRNLRGLIGYARHQAAKYGIRGSRLEVARRVLKHLKSHAGAKTEKRMADIWDSLPVTDYSGYEKDSGGADVYQVCGRQLQKTASVSHYVQTLEGFVRKYGERAEQARKNEGIDWKAVSHAFRAAFQLKTLFMNPTEGYTYPLPEAAALLEIKLGKWDYLTKAAPMLEALIDEVEDLAKTSVLPDEPDRGAARGYLVKTCMIEVTRWAD